MFNITLNIIMYTFFDEVFHCSAIGEGRGGFARQEECQTLVWNEARRIC
jgi:hypothetical protein